MKGLQIIFLVILSIFLVCPSIWAQNLLEVEGELTIAPAANAINVHGNFIKNVADPSLPQDAVTKVYVDNAVINYFLSLPNGLQTLLNQGEPPLNIINAGAQLTDFIGLNHAGGIIFYMNPNADGTGLVAASSDQSTGALWGCSGIDISGADGLAIGSGLQNTIDIEAECISIGTAADVCANLGLNGFTDWFLPSKDELNEMYTKIGQGASAPITNIGNFADTFYWSSSESNINQAWAQIFSGGEQLVYPKDFPDRVRAIRAF